MHIKEKNIFSIDGDINECGFLSKLKYFWWEYGTTKKLGVFWKLG